MKSIVFSFLCCILCVSSFAQTTFNYTADNTSFPNPERGFYHHTEAHSGDYGLLDADELRGYREEGITLILRVFYLEAFRDAPVSAAYLNDMRQDFQTARQAGVKIIVRFAYTQKSTKPFGDAPLEVVLGHMEQLKPLLTTNTDVIAVVQAGFIGTWGEWYYTDHFSEVVGQPTEADWQKRRQLISALLAAVPENRFIQLRTPNIKMSILQEGTALLPEEAFSGTDKARLGHHNDCFLASANDVGTYEDIAAEKNYLEQDTRYLPMGGETCGLAPPYSDCPNALAELSRFHWSYLNIDYQPQVLNHWREEGCFTEVEQQLGYRYRLMEATSPTQHKPGGAYTLTLKMTNDGWANVYNTRKVEIVLKNEASGQEYFIPTNEDPRRWPLGEAINVTVNAGIPANLPEGNYQVYLNMPDPALALADNPDYAIRLANTGVWNPTLGYNDLGIALNVAAANGGEDYTGNDYFKARLSAANPTINTNRELFSGADPDRVLLYWGKADSSFARVIEKSGEGENFEKLTSVNAALDYFLDTNVTPAGNYQYRYYLTDGTDISDYSDTVTVQVPEDRPKFYDITIDGSDEDWRVIPPVATQTLGNAYAMRVLFDTQYANFLLTGKDIAAYTIYLDTDHDTATGGPLPGTSVQGFDYRFDQNILFEYREGSWQEARITLFQSAFTTDTDYMEVAVALSDLKNLEDNQQIPIAAIYETAQDSVYLPGKMQGSVLYERMLSPATPASLAVRKSGEMPASRLVVSWDACANCLGYVLERSKQTADFVVAGDFAPGITLFRDDNLTDQTQYTYRIYAYNQIGPSITSAVVSESTGEVALGIEEEISAFLWYPNPVQDQLTIKLKPGAQVQKVVTLQLLTLSGSLIYSRKISFTKDDEITINTSRLSTGVYLLGVRSADKADYYKIVKL